jgi:eukaryotic-like serine/threonine-protein kinase
MTLAYAVDATPLRSRILIVDDEPFNVDYLEQELEGLGYETLSAQNGREALDLVTVVRPDLILLDVMMPVMDGFTVCRTLKADDELRLIPIVIMTALNSVEDRVKGIEAGADDFLTKPVDDRELRARIATALRMKHAIDRKLEDLRELAGQEDGRAGVAGMRFGPYRVVEQIASGGMAVVYSAINVHNEEAAALKVLPAAWGDAPELKMRLEREAAALQRINHRNVVRVLDVGPVDARAGGGCFIAMEWLPHALDRVLQAHAPEPLPVTRALTIAVGIADGLAAVHSAGFIHRDVKPSNVLLRMDGTPVLTDFGLLLARHLADRRLTQTNVVVGTADYISPEQVAGLELDGRGDIYALGIVLYEMLAGFPPFVRRDPMDTLRAHVAEPPRPLSKRISAPVRRIVDRALAKRPAERYQTAGQMAAAIRDALGATS